MGAFPHHPLDVTNLRPTQSQSRPRRCRYCRNKCIFHVHY